MQSDGYIGLPTGGPTTKRRTHKMSADPKLRRQSVEWLKVEETRRQHDKDSNDRKLNDTLQ